MGSPACLYRGREEELWRVAWRLHQSVIGPASECPLVNADDEHVRFWG